MVLKGNPDQMDSIPPGANEIKHNKSTKLTQILLAYDGSEHAKAAVQLLIDLPLTTNTSITILAVMPTQWITGHEELQAALDAAEDLLRKKTHRIYAILKAGNPAATINHYASELKADLIIVGAKGLRATLGILLGGVAQQVVEYSCCPVLVVRAPYQKIKRILVLTDGSSYSMKALEFLAPLPERIEHRLPISTETEVYVMHILPPTVAPELASRAWAIGPEVLYSVPPTPIEHKDIEAREEREGLRILDEASCVLSRSGISAKKVLRRGDAATEILQFAKAEGVDLMICGSRGLSQITGWLLGSVSRKLVHYGNCSVLIVK